MSIRVGVSGRRPDKWKRYAEALKAVGLEPVMLAPPETRSLEELGLRGLVLSGGTDVDPALYGQTPADESDRPDVRRDRMEARLLREALQKDVPVLGICRGLQFLNVFHGGTLFQHHKHQARHRVRPADAALPAHGVMVRAGSRLARILGAGRVEVNSRHHQAADRVRYPLAVSARALDGTVEGLERRDKAFVVAVQWHPEDQVKSDARQRKLFEAFREAVRKSGTR